MIDVAAGIQTESTAHCWVAAWLLQNAFAEAGLVEPCRSLEAELSAFVLQDEGAAVLIAAVTHLRRLC